MAERKALVLLNGELAEMPDGDTLEGASSGGGGGVTNTFRYWRWTFTENSGWSGITIGYIAPTGVALVGTPTDGGVTYGPATNAFDGDVDEFWGGSSSDLSAGIIWAQFVFDEPVWIGQYDIVSRSGAGNQGPGGWILEYSEDGITWFLVDTVTGESGWTNAETRTYVCDTDQPGVLELAKPHVSKTGLFLQAKSDGTADWEDPFPEYGSADSGKVLGVDEAGENIVFLNALGDPGNVYNFWRITFTEAGTWSGGAAGEIEFRGEIGGTDLAFGGIATAGSEAFSTKVENLFDNNLNTDWVTSSNGVANGVAWVQYQFPVKVWIKEYAISPRAGNNAAQTSRGWILEYSVDGIDWTIADTVTGEASWTAGETRVYTVSELQPLPANVPLPGLSRGDRGKVLTVKSDESAAEWLPPVPDTLSSTGTDRVVTDADLFGNQILECNNAAANTVTVNTGLDPVTPLRVIQMGSGQTSFVAGSGVTIHSLGGNLSLAGQYASALLIPKGTDTYLLVGDLV